MGASGSTLLLPPILTQNERSCSYCAMRKGEATRAAILDRGVQLATQIGLEGLTIGRLAADLGLSKSGLFAHFRSKEALQIQVLDAAAERFVEEVVRAAVRQPRGEPRMVALYDRWLAWAKSNL